MRILEEDRNKIINFQNMFGGGGYENNYAEPIALHAIERAIAAESKVEEMQKTLEWYADEENYGTGILSKHGFIPIDNDNGDRARQALKGVTHE